jgi:hypothetical protein
MVIQLLKNTTLHNRRFFITNIEFNSAYILAAFMKQKRTRNLSKKKPLQAIRPQTKTIFALNIEDIFLIEQDRFQLFNIL